MDLEKTSKYQMSLYRDMRLHAGGKMSSGVSKTTPGFDGSKLEDSADSHVHGYDILEQKETKKISKGKWCMG